MTPVELAASVYAHEPCARTFREDLEAHLLNGHVFSAPDFFVMGRVVDSQADGKFIVDPWVRFDEGDAWLVYLAAGDLRAMWRLLPFPKEFIGWERSNVLRFWRFESLQKRLCTRTTSPMTLEARIFTGGLLAPMDA